VPLEVKHTCSVLQTSFEGYISVALDLWVSGSQVGRFGPCNFAAPINVLLVGETCADINCNLVAVLNAALPITFLATILRQLRLACSGKDALF
jgi:hypothetical protein